MTRYARLARLRPDKIDQYLRLHAAVWPEVLAALHRAGVRNYTIFRRGDLLFSYFEYAGSDYPADRARLLADPAMERWNRLTAPCLLPADPPAGQELWPRLEEIFHTDSPPDPVKSPDE